MALTPFRKVAFFIIFISFILAVVMVGLVLMAKKADNSAIFQSVLPVAVILCILLFANLFFQAASRG